MTATGRRLIAGLAAAEIAGALLEREGEASEIDAMLASARAGVGRLLVIEGHAGIGKSVLVAVARERALERGMLVLAGRGTELERGFAFGLCLQLFEPRLAREDVSVREQLFSGAAAASRALFEGVAAEPTGHQDRIFALVHGLFWLCANLAERGPLLVAVDDAHWADRASLRFLLYLCERLPDLPVALLVTTRPGEPGASRDLLERLAAQEHARVRRLAALTESAAAALVRRRWPAAVEPFARACARVSGGNPFYLLELVHALEAEGIEADADSVEEIGRYAPDTVLRAVLVRLARFPAAASALARAVAVLGGETQLHHAAALAELEPARAARVADSLASAEILSSGEPISYVHPLLRATVYADIPAGERGLLHARAARIVARDLPTELAASHVLLAPATGDAWAVELLREAARKALAAGGAESAVDYLRRALSEPPSPEIRAKLLVELAEAEAIAGARAEDAVQHLEQAIALMRNPRERAGAALQLGWMLQKTGRLAHAAEAFSRGLDELGGAEDDLATLLEVGYLGAAWLDASRAREVLERRAALLARRGSLGKEAERALLANEVHLEVFAAASHERVIELAIELLDDGALIEEEGSDSLNVWVAVGCLSWSDALDEAEAAIELALADASRRGAFLNSAMGYCLRAWPRYWRGRLAEAAADAQVAIDACAGGWSMMLPVARLWLGLCLLELDDLDAADAALGAPEKEWWGGTLMHGALLAARGRLALARLQPELALSELRQAGRLIVDTFSFDNPNALPWRADAALAAAQLGDAAQARELLGEDLAVARRFGAPRAVGVSLRAAGLIEGGERGVGLLREAVTVLESSPSTLELARALIDLGATLRRSGKRAEAREPLRRGLALVEDFGAFRLERQARDELAATGARARQRALTARDSLTPSELRVAEMAAAGMSNREIAQSLFVTVKAVKWHLGNAYKKLEVTSRKHLRDALDVPASGGSPGD